MIWGYHCHYFRKHPVQSCCHPSFYLCFSHTWRIGPIFWPKIQYHTKRPSPRRYDGMCRGYIPTDPKVFFPLGPSKLDFQTEAPRAPNMKAPEPWQVPEPHTKEEWHRMWVIVMSRGSGFLDKYLYMGAARFPGPPNLHDLQNWFKQLILQLPICICIVQHVTWEIGLPSFIETVQGVRSAPHRSFTLHKVFQRVVKENKEK